jgi:uncharacterized phage infection (PIP) family protein YhgE
MTYSDDWKLCKKTFEAKAGKKPSETFFGVFRRSTGMQDAAKALDAAQKNLDAKEIDKAVATYTKTSGSYRKLLEAASKEDKGVDYKAALTELDRGMDRILAAFQEAVKALAQGKAEELLKEAEKNSTAIQKEFDAGYQAFKDAYSAYEECKRIVRTVCDTAATDTKGAKKLAAGLSVPCKNIATLSGRIDKTLDSLEKTCKSMQGLKKSQPDFVINLAAQKFDDIRATALELHFQLKNKREEVKELVSLSKDAVKTAADAIKDAVALEDKLNHRLVILLREVRREAEANTSKAERLEKSFDTASSAWMKAIEGKVPESKLKVAYTMLFRETDELAKHCAEGATRVIAGRERLVSFGASYVDDKVVNEKPQLKKILSQIQEELGNFSGLSKRLNDLADKFRSLNKKVREEL